MARTGSRVGVGPLQAVRLLQHDTAAYKFESTINRCSAGNTTLSFATTVLYEAGGATAWDANLEDVGGGSGPLRIRVTGEANTNIRWVAVVRTSEVAWVPNLALLNTVLKATR